MIVGIIHLLGVAVARRAGEPAECIALEDKLISTYALKTCVVVPDLDLAGGSEKQLFAALGAAGANFLYRRLEQSTPITVGSWP